MEYMKNRKKFEEIERKRERNIMILYYILITCLGLLSFYKIMKGV